MKYYPVTSMVDALFTVTASHHGGVDMKVLVGFNFGLTCLITMLFAVPALAVFDDWIPYDDFNAKEVDGCKGCINTEKWGGMESFQRLTEVESKIKGKRGFFALRHWGSDESNEGRQSGVVGMNFNDDPASITGICFTPRIKKYALSDCAANESGSRARMRYVGHFYDTNTATDSDDGHLVVYLNFTHDTRDDQNGWLKKGEFKVDPSLERCVSSGTFCDGQTWNAWENGADLDLGVLKKANKTEICVGYDADNHEFILSAGDIVKTVNGPDHGLPTPAFPVHPNRVRHTIQLRSEIENCEAGILTQSMEGDFDNVKVRRSGLGLP